MDFPRDVIFVVKVSPILIDPVCFSHSIFAEVSIVVALIEDEATVKTFYKEKDHIRLQPENSTMDPIIVPNCEILGKVAGVFRKM